jgi:hypothetical protein
MTEQGNSRLESHCGMSYKFISAGEVAEIHSDADRSFPVVGGNKYKHFSGGSK